MAPYARRGLTDAQRAAVGDFHVRRVEFNRAHDYAEIPPETERVIFFPRAAGG